MDEFVERDFMNNSGSPAIYRPKKVLLILIILSFLSSPLFCEPNSPQTDPNAIIKSDTNTPSVKTAEPVKNTSFENKIIDKILVQGNIYIKKQKVLSAARSRAGQAFLTSQVQEDCKRIAGVLGVEFAYYNVEPAPDDKVILTFVVKEKIVIRKLTFTGDKKTKANKLTEKIGFQRGDYLDKLTASNGAENLTDYYKKSGYPFVKITYDDSKINEGILAYTIDTGPRVKIKKLK
jgi:outer membrane protein assembly factor BamA